MNTNNSEIIRTLSDIVDAVSPTQVIAGDLESLILDSYPDADDDERFEDMMHILASYKPSGGDYLYDGDQLKDECKRLLGLLKGR